MPGTFSASFTLVLLDVVDVNRTVRDLKDQLADNIFMQEKPCTHMADLKEGKTYIGKVERISGSGNGIIQKRKCGSMISESGHLLIPEANESWVGERVKFEYLGGNDVRVISRDPSREVEKRNKSNPVGDQYLNNDNDLLGGHQ